MVRDLGNPKFVRTLLRKPGVQEIYDNIGDYSEDQIEALDMPRWIRQALTLHKDGTLAQRDAPHISEEDITNGVQRDPILKVYRWISGDWHPKVTKGLAVDITDGDLLGVYDGIVKISSTRMHLSQRSVMEFQQRAQYVADMKLSEFNSATQDSIADKYKGQNIPTIGEEIDTSTPMGRLGFLGVRIGK